MKQGEESGGAGTASRAVTLPKGTDLESAPPEQLRETIAWQQRRFDAVIEIGRALGRTLDLDTVLQIIMEQVTLLMDADRSTLFLLDRRAGELWSMVAQGVEIKEIRMAAGKGIAGWVAQTGEVVNIPDAYSDERFNREIDQATGYKTESILTVPVFDSRHEVMGAVQCLNKRGGPFTEYDEALAASLVAQAAVSLENSQLYRDLIQRNQALVDARSALEHKVQEVDLLYNVERSISAAADLEETLDTLLEQCCQVIRAEAASVMLLEEESGQLFFKAASGPSAEALRRVRIGLDRGIAGMVARLGVARIVNDVSQDPHHDTSIDQEVHFETHSLLAAPLRARGKVIGAIEVLNRQSGGGFTEGDLKLLVLIAGQASRAIAIRQAREAEEKAERLSLLGQMVSGILHDLKTPMTVISGHAQLMALEDDGAKREAHCESLLAQFDNINAMTREILAFAKGKREILVRRVFLNRFIDETRELLQPEIERHKIILKVIDGYRGAARFDEGKMKRVVANLARNACEAMEPGGTFTWEISRQDDHLVFRFADDGPGIPPEMEGRLFQSFASHGKSSGTGLGLAIVKKIVQEHGGAITYESKEGEGTTFTVTLPLAGEDQV
ncbi:MAG: GAF domain-containing sensor histidine kinase [Deltaproteobacteria bacterium]|nr:GAF domain-containing sensor histidine kinase [Deltaproteobacteria bacterium]